MSRVPTPGGDNNNWGTVLNDYLQQALAADGKLVTSATNSFTGTANTNLASGTTPGLVQLTNDMGGTAASPQVVATHLSSALPVNQGGTGATSLAANNVLLGNGTSALQTVAPGTSGYVLMSNGTTWSSQPTPVITSFSVDGGSATTNFSGTLRIDFGSAT